MHLAPDLPGAHCQALMKSRPHKVAFLMAFVFQEFIVHLPPFHQVHMRLVGCLKEIKGETHIRQHMH